MTHNTRLTCPNCGRVISVWTVISDTQSNWACDSCGMSGFWIEMGVEPVLTPAAAPTVQVMEQKPRPCSECRQEETCRRISYCAAYRCGFGEDDAP